MRTKRILDANYLWSGYILLAFVNPKAELIYTGLGRPRFRVSAVETNQFYGVYRSGKDVALHLGISLRTLERKKEINITVSERTGSCSTYINILDKQLCSAVRKALEILPDASEFYIIGECCQRNIFAQG